MKCNICSHVVLMHLIVQEVSCFALRDSNSKRTVGNNFKRNKSNESKKQGYLKRSAGIKVKRLV